MVYGYVPRVNSTIGVFTITDRLSAPPSHIVGARYIVTSSPSGAWSSFAENDIVDDDGTNWFKRTPPTDCGWLAYVQDEDATIASSVGVGIGLASDTIAGNIEVATSGRRKQYRLTETPPGSCETLASDFHPSAVKVWGNGNHSAELHRRPTRDVDNEDSEGTVKVMIANDFSTRITQVIRDSHAAAQRHQFRPNNLTVGRLIHYPQRLA